MSAIQTYNTAFPFDVTIQNLYQGELLPVIYIVDKNTTAIDLMNLQVVITPNVQQQYQLQGYNFPTPVGSSAPVTTIPVLAPSNATFKPGSNQHNLSFAFRSGVLNDNLMAGFSGILQSAIASAVPTNICCVNGPLVRSTDGAFVWYCAFQNTLDIPSELSFTLNGINANSGVGSRSTQVEVGLNNLILNANSSLLRFTRSVHLDIVNHQGNSFAPLYFGVLGENTLQNNASNDLQIYFESIGRVPIQFGPHTTFSFRFTYDTPSSNLMHFGTQSQVKGILWGDAKGNNEVVPFNNLNQFNNVSNVNFNNEYETISGSSDDGSGNIILSQIFKHTVEETNTQFTSIQNQISDLNQNLLSSRNYYTGSSGPLSAIVAIKKAWPTEQISSDFKDSLDSLNQSYLTLFQTVEQNVSQAINTLQSEITPDSDAVNALGSISIDLNEQFKTDDFDNKFYNLFMAHLKLNGDEDNDSDSYVLAAIDVVGVNRSQSNSSAFYGPNGSTDDSNRWTDPDFGSFLSTNFKNIIVNLSASYSSNGIIASRCLYDYLSDVYTLYKLYKENKLHNALIDINSGFTKENWGNYVTAARNYFTQNNQSDSILSSDNVTVLPQFNTPAPWLDDDFYYYVKSNLQTLSVGLLLETKYLVPSASLFDFFYLNYQLSIYNALLASIPQTINIYINPVSCIFNFNSLQLSGKDGVVTLHIKAENIPGYWDTDFQVPIIKKTEKTSPAGSMLAYAGATTPAGWLKCDGSAIDSQYAKLISVVGANTPNMTAFDTNAYFWIIKC